MTSNPPHLVALSLCLALAACGSPSPPGALTPDVPAVHDTPDATVAPDAPDAPDATVTPDTAVAPGALRRRIAEGVAMPRTAPRPGPGLLAVRSAGDRVTFLEVTRRPDGSHVRSLRSLSFLRLEAAHEVFHDVVVHPSGALTLALERTDRPRDGYVLLRLDVNGNVLAEQVLPVGATLPASDRGGTLPDPPWTLRSGPDHALRPGWIRLAARGDDLALAFLSRVDTTSDALVSAVASLRWDGARYAEVFTRVVDGRHTAMAPAWQYDEFRFADALLRPLLAVDPRDGALLVGRTWTLSRCRAVRDAFGGLSATECATRTCGNVESRQHPFAYTVFTARGERGPTRSFIPRTPYYYTVFDFAARDGQVALAGLTSVQDEAKGVAFYDGDRVPFDGLLAVLDRESGALRWERHVGGARADMLTALRWEPEGLVAVGVTDWDRWDGGMSISRGGDPWMGFFSADDGEGVTRTLPRPGVDRHGYLLDVTVTAAGAVVAVGLDDAPLTHSGDGGNQAAMTFGGNTVLLPP